MLKQWFNAGCAQWRQAAAFGRLCVETHQRCVRLLRALAAAFGRLCVETTDKATRLRAKAAAAFGRLCVETPGRMVSSSGGSGSRLRAAVC